MNTRQKAIADYLTQAQEVSIPALVERFSASEATIRRDLAYLESEGKIFRTFGGARTAQGIFMAAKSFQERMQKCVAEKKRIAEAAASLIQPNMTIALDNGTTTWVLATLLGSIAPLTVITSSLPIIQAMSDFAGVSLMSMGGKLRLRNMDFVGSVTCENFRNWHTDISFVSGDSLRPRQGVYKIEDESASIVQAISFSTDKTVAVMDHTKINRNVGACLALPADRLSVLLTDRSLLTDGLFDGVTYKVEFVDCMEEG